MTYDKENLNQIVELIRYYVAHESERERIACNGREVVLRGHTMTHRAKTIVEHIQITDVQAQIMMRQSRQEETLNALSQVYEHAAGVYEVASQRYAASPAKQSYCLRAKDMYREGHAKIVQSQDRKFEHFGSTLS